MAPALRRFLTGPLPVIAVFLLLVVSLVIMAEATRSSEHFERWQWWTAGFNGVLGLMLISLIVISLLRLFRQLRDGETGSRLSLRMTVMFASFTLVPTALVFGFSIWLIASGIDSWFDVGVDDTLNNAREISRSSIDMQMRQRHAQINDLLDSSHTLDNPEAMLAYMHDLVARTGALEASLLDSSNTILVMQSDELGIVPDLPNEAQLRLLQESGMYMAQEQHPEHGSIIRILLRTSSSAHEQPLTLQTLYPLSEHMLRLTASVEEAAQIYQTLLGLREPLKYNLTFALSLALLLGLLFAVWAALYSAQRILSPIPALARGIKAVAEGEYSQHLPSVRSDELGQLVDAYNDMIQRLANARFVAETRRLTIQQQHTYLDAVLEHLSSGVISVDNDNKITLNRAANTILELKLDTRTPLTLNYLRAQRPDLEPLWKLVKEDSATLAEDQQLQLDDNRKVLHCHNALLPNKAGRVLVFEDITDLQQAQRQAAWGEVARRMAHEIKNPLTPIRLSTERLQRTLQPHLDTADAETLERATHTIVRQVEAMKSMINEFSEYATTRFTPTPTDLKALASEVMELYLDNRPEIEIQTQWDSEPTWVMADPDRLRQLLHNLIKNAMEAQEEQESGRIVLRTTVHPATATQPGTVTLSVQDAGPGFAPDMLNRACEPYVTTKSDGHGLGLAVAHRIVADHQGRIRLYNDAQGGGCVDVEFVALRRPSPETPA